jgi:hypothetical protein
MVIGGEQNWLRTVLNGGYFFLVGLKLRVLYQRVGLIICTVSKLCPYGVPYILYDMYK